MLQQVHQSVIISSLNCFTHSEASVSKNTHKSHRGELAVYSKLCNLLKCIEWPPQLQLRILSIFIITLTCIYYSKVIFVCNLIFLVNCKTLQIQKFLVSKLQQGIERLKDKADARLPTTKSVLQNIKVLPILCIDAFKTALSLQHFLWLLIILSIK